LGLEGFRPREEHVKCEELPGEEVQGGYGDGRRYPHSDLDFERWF